MNKIKVHHAEWTQAKELTIGQFEQLFNIRYLPQLAFANYKVEQFVKKKCNQAYKKGKIATYTTWLGHLHKRELAYHHLPDLTINYINATIGYGLFTNQPLQKAQFVGQYAGILRRRGHIFHNVNDYCFMYPREWLNFKPLTIDSEKYGNHTRFINHSDQPNLEALSVLFEGVFHLLFRTIEEIPAGKELTYDYGHIYWRRRKKIDYTV